ncbi:MAG: cupin domain-containing protein [Paenibacillus sp.]|uniref:cupin domain-containing protein n=1 Tax=Paenibacillus sp. TaxID=58172 RepID=UPI002906AD6E|nr:cupin domain-containing protein [Paenibacillus sp.]MDU4698317.1 cupin domain-containing protein [Paenibacillus sp.]
MISKQNAEHYVWGGNCDGWRLLDQEDYSIIHEKMPPDSQEVRHFHEKAEQFFFVLSGRLQIELDGNLHELHPHEGLEIPANTPHQAINRSAEAVEFLVISRPNTRGDRVLA